MNIKGADQHAHPSPFCSLPGKYTTQTCCIQNFKFLASLCSQIRCADPETFARGGATLMFYVVFLVDEGRKYPNYTKIGPSLAWRFAGGPKMTQLGCFVKVHVLQRNPYLFLMTQLCDLSRVSGALPPPPPLWIRALITWFHLVTNPEDRFSRVEAKLHVYTNLFEISRNSDHKLKPHIAFYIKVWSTNDIAGKSLEVSGCFCLNMDTTHRVHQQTIQIYYHQKYQLL